MYTVYIYVYFIYFQRQQQGSSYWGHYIKIQSPPSMVDQQLHDWISEFAGTSDHRLAFSPIFAHLCHSNGRKRFSLVLLVVVLFFHLKTRWSEFSQLALPCFVVKNDLDIIRTESAANAEVVRHHLFESLQYTMGPLETCRLVLPALPLGKQCQIEDQNVCAPFFRLWNGRNGSPLRSVSTHLRWVLKQVKSKALRFFVLPAESANLWISESWH